MQRNLPPRTLHGHACMLSAFLALALSSPAQPPEAVMRDGRIELALAGRVRISAPEEGQWSIATAWQAGWPSAWRHARIDTAYRAGPWQVYAGRLRMAEGEWHLRDAYLQEGDRIRCVRRYEWMGRRALDSVTLSVRWRIPATGVKAFLPGILYHGNPSGERNGPGDVAWFHGRPGEFAVFEEHRYPMPFAAAEWGEGGGHRGAALHSIPSPVSGALKADLWWSLGMEAVEGATELTLLSGPIGYNGRRSAAKALQKGGLAYGDAYARIAPGTVIEKTFLLQAYDVAEKGSGFERAMRASLDIFRPYGTEGLPTFDGIVDAKLRFARSRWIEGKGYAGFNMYPATHRPAIVMGWCGQAEAMGYALQVLGGQRRDSSLLRLAKASLDHLCNSPVDGKGFPVIYDIGRDAWSGPDPVSEGQAMYSMALALRTARRQGGIDPARWEDFLSRASAVHAGRILEAGWKPVNTAEAFYIAPLLLTAELLGEPTLAKAARKAADYYAARHIDMDEPYWGGTLDATCEDKEGAWAAFQGFLAMYEATGEEKYLRYARHAGMVTLSYTAVWDIPLPPGRLADHGFKSRGWTMVSAQNQHLDVFGVFFTPAVYRLGQHLKDASLMELAKVMFRSCGQLIDPSGSQGEQIQHTNFAQHGDMSDVYRLRGGYSEGWTVFWITTHFLHAAAQFREMGVGF